MVFTSAKSLPGKWFYDGRNRSQLFIVSAEKVKRERFKIVAVSYKDEGGQKGFDRPHFMEGRTWYLIEWPEGKKKNYREIVKASFNEPLKF